MHGRTVHLKAKNDVSPYPLHLRAEKRDRVRPCLQRPCRWALHVYVHSIIYIHVHQCIHLFETCWAFLDVRCSMPLIQQVFMNLALPVVFLFDFFATFSVNIFCSAQAVLLVRQRLEASPKPCQTKFMKSV